MKRLCFSGDKVRRYASVEDLNANRPIPDSLQDLSGEVTTNPSWETAPYEQIALFAKGVTDEEKRRVMYEPCTILPITEGRTWMSESLLAEFTIQ